MSITYEDHRSFRDQGTMPMEIFHRSPGERHAAHGVKSDAFFHNGTDVIDLLVDDTVPPSSVFVTPIHL